APPESTDAPKPRRTPCSRSGSGQGDQVEVAVVPQILITVDGVTVRFVADRQTDEGLAEDVDRVRGHVRSTCTVIGAQGNADGHRRTGGIDELLQPLQVIGSDGDLFVVLRRLSLRRPE